MTMRTAAAIAALSAGIALAAPAPATPAPTWADWVGDFDGAVAWRNCSAPGAPKATIRIAGVDGVLYVDLTGARGGLQKMSLVEEDDGSLAAQQGDLKLAIRRPRADAIDLAIELASGCAITGRFARAASGVAACDRLAAWARVEAACGKLATRREDASGLAKTAWKPADAASCTARADRLALALVDAGCAPHPDPLIGVRARTCLSLAQAAQKLARCGNLPRELADPIVARAGALAAAAQTADAGTLPVVEAQCGDARAEIVAIATRFRCSP